ncbi:histone deacetylase family protein [Caldivirga sp. UBA161]|uniref:histone deacetylase family protein n=1 Tax=Caldivirga sp. UBA161 TaxID=1915569 RepID=UPI0025C6DA56|nr:histone deacetylase family protein [Caldivirga sp. UBA161]
MLVVVYDEGYLRHETPANHPESPNRVLSALSGVEGLAEVIKPTVNVDLIEIAGLVHEYHYVEYVTSLCATGGRLDQDTYVSKGTCDALSSSVNALATAVNLLKSGTSHVYLPLRPPGHHVGFRGRALLAPTQGFCILNNAAIISSLLLRGGASRVAILDIDAHHGNGTQEIFYNTSRVFYISTHQDPRTIYPGTGYINEIGVGEGEGFNMNIPLPPMTGDDLFKVALKPIENALREYKPNYVVVSLGFDSHYLDPLTNLNLSLSSYIEVFLMVKRLIDEGITEGSVYIMEGGYNTDVIKQGSRALAMISNDTGAVKIEDHTKTSAEVVKYFNKMIEQHKALFPQYW